MIFQGLTVARNSPAPLTTLDMEREILCNFAKNLNILWDIVALIFSYYRILNLQNFL